MTETLPAKQSQKLAYWAALAALAAEEQRAPLADLKAGKLTSVEWIETALGRLMSRLVLAFRSADTFAVRDITRARQRRAETLQTLPPDSAITAQGLGETLETLPTGILPPPSTEQRLERAFRTILADIEAQIAANAATINAQLLADEVLTVDEPEPQNNEPEPELETELEDEPEDEPDEQEPDQAAMRVERLTQAETISAGQTAYAEAVTEHGEVWVRVPEPDACARCVAVAGPAADFDAAYASVHPECMCDIEIEESA